MKAKRKDKKYYILLEECFKSNSITESHESNLRNHLIGAFSELLNPSPVGICLYLALPIIRSARQSISFVS